jgi:tetratricopeptide (TPR) repeat protein
MLKRLFTILISSLLFYPLQAQQIHLVKSFADEQYLAGNYSSALKEYQRVLLFDEEKIYNDIYARVASICFGQQNFEDAIRYFNLAWRAEKNDSLKSELAFIKVTCLFKQQDYFLALTDLFDMPDYGSTYIKNKKDLYFGISYFGLDDYKSSLASLSQILDSTGIQKLNQIFVDYLKFRKKFRPEKVEMMSMFLPGLGQIYVGDFGSGINSIVLLSAIAVYAVYTTINYGFIDGVLLLSSWFYRYYSGGSAKAGNLAQAKIAKKKAKVYAEILSLVDSHRKITTGI